ncbi:molybdenum ABC transporter ATP-binding protein [Acidimangrovimonas sediminis]|uniref:molybdenum ABC transporter ATP-binding protein n=1 Tax=Acidimangrovimonas sediminis TaxID=2056283 RepID=UPI000C80AEB2|nr:molybdenum ABC transporter ATP-binding protein [Acidimangrovimonas sediminis]
MSLSVSFRHRFEGTSLDIAFEAPGGLTALFGHSGAGKTTVVNAVAGLLRPDEGHIAAGGAVLFDSASRTFLPTHRRRLGYVFQDARLFPHLSVRSNLLYGRRFAPKEERKAPTGAAPDAEIARVIDMLGLGNLLDRRPRMLSGGERQRVALGRAILSKPRLLLMDEPLAALDDARKEEILPYLERLRDETALPILYVSHSASEIARLATTVVLVSGGRVTAAGPTARILADPALAGALGVREAGAILRVTVAAQEEDGLTRLDGPAGPLWLPRIEAMPGTALRVRVLAQDVMLALDRPERVSALNAMPATVSALHEGAGPGVMVQLDVRGTPLLARVTRRSATALGLREGLELHAVLKAVSVASGNIGAGDGELSAAS